MADITMRKIRDEEFVQEAELHVPVDNPDEVKKAFEIVTAIRKRALDHLAVQEDNADYTVVDYKSVNAAGEAVLIVAQVLLS